MRWLLLPVDRLPPMLWRPAIVLITEYRRRRSIEARSRAILSSSFTDLAILDRNGVVEDCNDGWTGSRDSTNPFTAAKRGEPWLPDSPAMVSDDPAGMARVRDALLAVLSGRDAERTARVRLEDGRRARIVPSALLPHRASRRRRHRLARGRHGEQTRGKRSPEGAARARAHEHARRTGRAGVRDHPRADPVVDRIVRQRTDAQAHAPRPRRDARGAGANRRRHRRCQPRSDPRHRTCASTHTQGAVRPEGGRSECHRHGRRPGPELVGGQRGRAAGGRPRSGSAGDQRRPRAAQAGGDEPGAECGAGDTRGPGPSAGRADCDGGSGQRDLDHGGRRGAGDRG